MNASIALSGCSLSSRFRPLNIDCGAAAWSVARTRESKPRSNQPAANSSGRPIRYQASNSSIAALARETRIRVQLADCADIACRIGQTVRGHLLLDRRRRLGKQVALSPRRAPAATEQA